SLCHAYLVTRALLFSLHDALPISLDLQSCGLLDAVANPVHHVGGHFRDARAVSYDNSQRDHQLAVLAADLDASGQVLPAQDAGQDRKSTRLNSSHVKISYAVFCLK